MPTDAIARRIMAATFAALAVSVTGAAAAPPSTCAKLWFRVAGEGAKVQASCYAKAAGAGTAVDPACLATAAEKLAHKWAKAALKGDCPTTADAATAQARVDAYLASVVDLLTPPVSHCCAKGSVCYSGASIDTEGCEELLGTLGPPGSVCDGATGACVTPPGAGGSCCDMTQLAICTAGPGVDPVDCVAAGGTDVPNGVCQASGSCVTD